MTGPESPRTLAGFRQLESAEEYLRFFGITYDPAVLAVSRLHVLRRFSRDLAEIDGRDPAPAEEARLALYEDALGRAYALFRWSSPRAERLFAVLRDDGPGGSGCAGCGGGSGCGG